MNTIEEEKSVEVMIPTIKQRLMAIVQLIMDELPAGLSKSGFDPVVQRIIKTLLEKQLPKLIENTLAKTPDEEIRKQIEKLRDEIIPFLLDGQVITDENKNQ